MSEISNDTDGRYRDAPDALATTRRSLHGVAELLLAGPQHRGSGTIRLRVGRGGFSTVAAPDVAMAAPSRLVLPDGQVPLAGTYAEVGAAAGIDVGAPEGLYHDGSGVSPDEQIVLDPEAEAHLLDCLLIGDTALRQLSEATVPVLWPEHFDVGITVDEVNFGVSLGDGFLGEPYAYVGPWKPRSGDFWNAPFGAARPLAELVDAAGVAEFFVQGQRLAAEG